MGQQTISDEEIDRILEQFRRDLTKMWIDAGLMSKDGLTWLGPMSDMNGVDPGEEDQP